MFSKMRKTTKVIEKQKRFKDSILWRWQEDYFKNAGVDAWSGTVPYYITSNPFIATSYANIVMRYIQDLVRQKRYNKDEPFYILEIGTGPGKFSFYAVEKIFALQKALKLDDVTIVYLMSDFTDSNVQYWEKHPALKPYVDKQQLQFARYNIVQDSTIRIVKNGTVAATLQSTKNPLIVFANYLFDSIPHDVFHIEDGKLYEALTVVKVPAKDMNKENKPPEDLEKVQVSFEYNKIKADAYYDDPAINKILQDYQAGFEKTSVLLPITGLLGLQRLLKIANKRMLLIGSDKGYNCMEQLSHLHDPGVTFHRGACFSMMVNFDAIGRYFTHQGGEAFHQSQRVGLKTSACILGDSVDDLIETKLACSYFLEQFGPVDFFNFHRHVRATYKQADFKLLLSHMQLCQWDPHIFHLLVEHINDNIHQESALTRQAFIDGMAKLAANTYRMPADRDTFFAIATFFHNLQYYKQAIDYYNQSLENFGENFTNLYNLALCYYLTDALEPALDLFKRAKRLNPTEKKVDEWITRITEKHPVS